MLHVCSSNSLERLAGALADRLRSRVALLEPEAIVVPNGNVATYAKLAVARRNGVAANLALDHWEGFLTRLLEAGGPRRLLHRRAVAVLLAGVLVDPEEVERLGAEPLRRYVRAARPGERDLHTYQLAVRLAALFEEYHLNRPELIAAWQAGKLVVDGPDAATERWQSAVWRRLFAAGGVRDELQARTGERWVLPAEVGDALAGATGLPARMHVFGFSYLPRGYLALLRRLADAIDVSLYTFVPVRPPVETGGDLHLALKMWGRPGLEYMGLLAELGAEQHEQLFGEALPPAGRGLPAEGTKARTRRRKEDPSSIQLTLFSGTTGPQPRADGPPPSFLKRIQRDIEAGRGPAAAAGAPPDASLTVLACPGIQREVEVVAGKIWTLLREEAAAGRPLRFDDIAILVADTARFDAYESHIRAVFQDVYGIPTSVSDARPASQGRVLESIDLLLALPEGQFRRPELLKLLTQPALLARFGRTDAEDWKRWCERTAIYFGADRSDLAGLYVEKDLLTWEQGLRRLALGAFLAAPAGEAPIFEIEGERYVPEEVRADELSSVALLASLVRALVAEARFARTARLPLAEWSRHFTRLCGTYLAGADRDDEMLLAQARRELGRLAELDLAGRPIPARIAAELAREALGRIPGGRGHYLADGVVVSSLQPMRPIPFAVAFVVGLGEGCFPGSDGLDALDLRRAQRAEGDVTVRERDQYLFLEAIVSTARRLYLSYVSRDAQTGEEANPSSAVEELLWMVQQSYPGDGDPREALVERHPLRRWDEDPAKGRVVLSPRARREALLRGLERPELMALSYRQRVELLRRDPVAAQRWLGLIPIPPPSPAATAARVEMPIAALRRFLECPLQGWARAVLGLVEEDTTDPVACEDEPFACEVVGAASLLGDVFRGALARGDDALRPAALDAAFDAAADRAELSGALPTGAFGQAERRRMRSMLHAWRDQLVSAPPRGPVEALAFGRAEEGARVTELLPPIVLDLTHPDGRPLQVVLHGRTQPVDAARTVSIKTVMRKDLRASDHLGGWVDHVVLAASGEGGEGIASRVIGAPKLDAQRTFDPMTRDDARDYLGGLVAEMLWTAHAYFLPVEAADALMADADVQEVCDELRVKQGTLRSDFGPVPHPRSYEPPPDRAARDIVRRRLPFLADGEDA